MINSRNGFGNDSHTIFYLKGEDIDTSPFRESSKYGKDVYIDSVSPIKRTLTHGNYGQSVSYWNNNNTSGLTCTSNDFYLGKFDFC